MNNKGKKYMPCTGNWVWGYGLKKKKKKVLKKILTENVAMYNFYNY